MASVYADTIHMKNGVRIEGKVLRSEDQRVVVQIGAREVRLRQDEIGTIEKNNKDGSLDLAEIRRQALERDQELTAQYGLTNEERQSIMSSIESLTDSDPVKQGEARRSLLAFAAEKNIFAFLKDTAETSLPWVIPALLRIMVEIEPTQTESLARSMAFHVEENVRAAAIEVLGLTKDKSSMVLMMRGILDHTSVVQMASCSALAAIKAREATPLLLRRINAADLRVHNYAVEALAIIWGLDREEASANNKEQWEEFWNTHKANILPTVDLETLEPLVPPDTYFRHC